MPLTLTRRDILKFVGGSIAGIMVTPIPWKLLDDVSIWTQNGPWIPKVPRGALTTSFSTCALCPAGCGVQARCVNGIPYFLSGTRNHPVNNGTLCPSGVAAHHLAYHPLRLKTPVQVTRGNGTIEVRPVSLDDVLRKISVASGNSTGAKGSLALLDQRPGRTVSLFYRKQLARHDHGIYLVSPTDPILITQCLDEMAETPFGPVGYHLENVRTILSFAAPVLDGWGTPAQTSPMLRTRHSSEQNAVKVIQIDSRHSRSAQLADQWIPLKPKTEAALAFGIAHVIIRDGLYDKRVIGRRIPDFNIPGKHSYSDLIGRFTPDHTSELTGVSSDVIVSTAHSLVARGPSVAIGDGDSGGGPLGKEAEIAIWGLNILLGALESNGSIVQRREAPVPEGFSSKELSPVMGISAIPDHSIGLLLIDGSDPGDPLPWSLLERKLIPRQSLVVACSPTLTGLAQHAQYVVPTPAHLEALTDIPTIVSSATATFSISAPLLKRPEGMTDAIEIMAKVFETEGSMEDLLKQRTSAIFATRRGCVFKAGTGTTVPITELGSPDEFWTELTAGGMWTDDPIRSKPFCQFHFMGRAPDAYQRMLDAGEAVSPLDGPLTPEMLTVLPYGRRAEVGGAQLSPLMTKLYQESGLHRSSKVAVLNPATAKKFDLVHGEQGILATACGTQKVGIRVDAAVMPGVIEIAAGPEPIGQAGNEIVQEQNILELIDPDQALPWRAFRATLRKA